MSHWERDINSGTKRNVGNHAKVVSGGNASICKGTEPAKVTTCSNTKCAYTVSEKAAHTKSATLTRYSSTDKYHVYRCTVCNETAQNVGNCYTADGKVLDCNNTGTCAGCKAVYSTVNIHAMGNGGICRACGFRFINVFDEYRTKADGNSVIRTTVTPIAGQSLVTGVGSTALSSTSGAATATSNRVSSTTSQLIVDTTINFTKRANVDYCTPSVSLQRVQGGVTYSDTSYITFNVMADVTAPTINSIDTGAVNEEWQNQKLVTVKATDTWSELVEIALFDSTGGVVSDWGTATKSGTTFTRIMTPILEAGTSGEVFIVKARDMTGNTSQKSFTLKNVDSKAPVLKQINGLEPNIWRRNKLVRVICTDAGIGQIQIAFNDESDFKPATYDEINKVYYRDFEFTGTVVGVQNRYFYIKDGLGNITAKLFEIGHLDNRAPESPTYKEQLGVGDGKLANTNEIMVEWLIGSDGESGANRVEYSYDCEHWEIGTKQTVRSNQTIFSRTIDNVGNISTVTMVDVLLDIDKPLVGYTDDG